MTKTASTCGEADMVIVTSHTPNYLISNDYLINILPRISLGGHPFALHLQRLLNDVAHAAFSTFAVADVNADFLHFFGSISRANGHAHHPHHADVGNVVAHVHNLFGLQVLFGHVFIEFQYLIWYASEDIKDIEAIHPLNHGRTRRTRNQRHVIAQLRSQLKRIAILHVGSTPRTSIGIGIYFSIGQNAIIIKNKGRKNEICQPCGI